MNYNMSMVSMLLSVFWILFGIQTHNLEWVLFGGLISIILFCVLMYRWRSKDATISSISLLLIFFTFFLVSRNFWISGPMENVRLLTIVVIGILYLIIGENLKNYPKLLHSLLNSITITSFFLAILWLMAKVFSWGIDIFGPASMIVHASNYQNHNHMGDFLILAIILLSINRNKLALLLLIPLYFSFSRSGVLGLLIGLGYLLHHQFFKIHKKHMFFIIALFVMLFAAISVNKITFDSRHFYIQSAKGLINHPLGVGYGNFGEISLQTFNPFLQINSLSTYAHSIIFEWISGVGWFSILGLLWLGITAWNMGKVSKSHSIITFRSLWWAMLIPMLFDTVYVIPSYWWLWMLVTGLALKDRIAL